MAVDGRVALVVTGLHAHEERKEEGREVVDEHVSYRAAPERGRADPAPLRAALWLSTAKTSTS